MRFKSDYGELFQKRALAVAGPIVFVLAAVTVMFAVTGCMMSSISESSDSFSAVSKSSSNSSSSSSDDEKESYLRDIQQYTVVYARSNSDIRGFVRGLTIISEQHGLTDWEAYSATYLGIGEGFAKAAVTEQQLYAYSSYLTAGDQAKIAAIMQGFSQGH